MFDWHGGTGKYHISIYIQSYPIYFHNLQIQQHKTTSSNFYMLTCKFSNIKQLAARCSPNNQRMRGHTTRFQSFYPMFIHVKRHFNRFRLCVHAIAKSQSPYGISGSVGITDSSPLVGRRSFWVAPVEPQNPWKIGGSKNYT